MTPRIYLDHAATTPMRPEAIVAVAEGMARWANPSSPHGEGRAARRALEDARARIAAALGWDGEVILTSGASEAIRLAIRGRAGAYVAATEHDAVLRAAVRPTMLAVDARGRVIFPPFVPLETNGLWAVQTANSETGVVQSADAVARAIRAANGRWIADASQTAGKLPLPDADMIVVSAHKLGGPIGIGALLVRDLALLTPTGGQERGYRDGTENLPGALGFAAALEAPRDWFDAMTPLRARLDAAIVDAGGEIIGFPANARTRDHERYARDPEPPRPQEHGHIPTIASYRMPGVSAGAQLIRFDMAGFAVSAGSACSSGSMKPSHVLAAMGISPGEAAEVIRVSFGWPTTADEVDAFALLWCRTADAARVAA
ncbi:cysteine desulfurase family protein [Sphingomonas bacterium]|uniref:cysteine desulfurase family protein n=1 Tax=Sphingomonas bacterium TaxID=1895847 RepID=UPI001575E926|nr:aminotransferase class V-fold PLP-dependent enzyme [Sphingomonas bacterium]